MTEIVANKVCVRVGAATIVEDASLTLKPGELVAILGPNGAGKTSLLRTLLGITKTTSGSAELNGEDCFGMPPSERAKIVSYLPQRRPLAWPYRVHDVVALGRFAHGAALGRLSPIDSAAVEDAINACKLGELQHRSTDNLSGGELARVHFARAIAGKAPLLIADEPVAELDPKHQILVADLIRQFVNDGGGALVVLHEVALAARIADRLIWMKNGRIIAEGSPKASLNSKIMQDDYGVRAQVGYDEQGIDIRVESAT
jgi:iron complex transport system ATP-binding protein